MAWENLPLGAYRIPRDGTDDDTDDIDYTATSPVTVGQSGTAEFKLRVNWPTALDNVQVTILLPDEASSGNASITPTQTNQSIDTQGDRAVFTHPAANNGDEITYSLGFDADTAGTVGVSFKLEADDLAGPVSREVQVEFEAS